jgi:hypothetical protein
MGAPKRCETYLAQLSDAMADPATYSVKEKAKEVQAEYESLEPRLSELYAEWETAAG